jgi:hypothetical protein
MLMIYSSWVMISAYELEYSPYVMNIAYRTVCLIIHATYMGRIRDRLRWQFVLPSGLSVSYALYTGVVLRYTGTFGCDGASRLRGRRQVVTALSVHCNPPHSVIRIGVRKCPSCLLVDQCSEISPSILHLGLGLTMYLYDHSLLFA